MKKNKQQQKEIFLQRIKCNCVAQKHELINNCLSCGKVVCAQEGEGPCLYCGNVVTKPDGKYIINDQALFPELPKQQLNKISQERSKAVIHKNILIERDKSTSSTQNIYDQTIDYYDVSQNQWLDEQSRQNAIDKLLQKDKFVESEKLKQRVVFDPLTGKFVSQQFHFDQESFKEEGRNYMKEKEKEQLANKMEKAKHNWDTRFVNNDKIKEIVNQLKSQAPLKKEIKNKIEESKAKNRVTQLIIQQQTGVAESQQLQAQGNNNESSINSVHSENNSNGKNANNNSKNSSYNSKNSKQNKGNKSQVKAKYVSKDDSMSSNSNNNIDANNSMSIEMIKEEE